MAHSYNSYEERVRVYISRGLSRTDAEKRASAYINRHSERGNVLKLRKESNKKRPLHNSIETIVKSMLIEIASAGLIGSPSYTGGPSEPYPIAPLSAHPGNKGKDSQNTKNTSDFDRKKLKKVVITKAKDGDATKMPGDTSGKPVKR